VDLPFPRDRTSDAFMQVFRQVHALIHEEIVAPEARGEEIVAPEARGGHDGGH
jgi:hypothetical protein